MSLRLDWCSYEAAKYAVEHWHYSRTMPAGKRVHIGVWEAARFIGAVIFSTGAAPQSHCPYGIARTEICELTRVALHTHHVPVSRIVALAIRLLRKLAPGLRLIVSYADPDQGHIGGIYQAGNWTYVGMTGPEWHFIDQTGRHIHSKTLKTGRPGYAAQLKAAGHIRQIATYKYKYLYPLDAAMRAQIAPLGKPYPKRAGSIAGDAVPSQVTEGGSIPTPALHVSEARA